MCTIEIQTTFEQQAQRDQRMGILLIQLNVIIYVLQVQALKLLLEYQLQTDVL